MGIESLEIQRLLERAGEHRAAAIVRRRRAAHAKMGARRATQRAADAVAREVYRVLRDAEPDDDVRTDTMPGVRLAILDAMGHRAPGEE